MDTTETTNLIAYSNMNYNDEDDFLFQSLLYETVIATGGGGGGRVDNKNNNNDIEGIININNYNDSNNNIINVEEDDDDNDHYVDLGDMEFAHKMISSEPIPKLNCMNIMNFISYIWNVSVNIIVGYYGLFGLMNTSESVAYGQYQSILTPSMYACYIWVIIFILDGLFSFLQLLHPQYRGGGSSCNNNDARDGIGIMFFYSNIIQSLLTITYSFQYFFLSFILHIYLLVCLNTIFIEQLPNHSSSSSHHHNASSHHQNQQYHSSISFINWLILQLPFQLKYAWVLYCTCCIVFIQSLIVHSESITTQLTSCIICFVILTSVAISFLMPYYSIFGISSVASSLSSTTTNNNNSNHNNNNIIFNKPNYVIPIVILWSFVGTYKELQNPKDTIQTLFGNDIIIAIRYSSIGCCIIIACFSMIRFLFIFWVRRSL